MHSTWPFQHLSQITGVRVFSRRAGGSFLEILFTALLLGTAAHAQGGVPLVTVATDQSQLDLSNQFGVPAGSAINQAGDFAFVGNGGTALFFRPTGASPATRLLQIDDEVPGFPGRTIASIWPQLGINSSGTLFFGVTFDNAIDPLRSALLTYDGTTFHTVVTSEDIAPGSGNAAYGSSLVPGSIDDSGDINFTAEPAIVTTQPGAVLAISTLTYYILPAGATIARRVAAWGDTPPPTCTWCVASSSSPTTFLTGTPTSSVTFLGVSSIPPLNAQGKMLLKLWGGLFIGTRDSDGITLVPMAASGACSPKTIPIGTTTHYPYGILNGYLNDSGVVAFTNASGTGIEAICVAPANGGPAAAVVTSNDPAPAPTLIGATIPSPFALEINNSGDIIFESANPGVVVIGTTGLLRYHQSTGQLDVVAYNGEAAPGTPSGTTFSPGPGLIFSISTSAFSGVSMANDGRVSFRASLSTGGSGIYRQTGAFSSTNTPELIFLDAQPGATPILGVPTSIFSPVSQTKILDSGPVFFSTFLTGGAADFAEYLGAPGSGNLHSLMSTADLLPAGARKILLGAPPEAAGHFVAFTAQPAGGRVNLLVSDLTTGTITRVVSDNDPALAAAGGPAGSTVVAPNFFLNENGQIAFETVAENTFLRGRGAILFGSGSAVNGAWLDSNAICGTIYLWSPPNELKKVVAPGDAAPVASSTSAKFSCVALHAGAPSPLSPSGQLAFSSPSPFPLASMLPCSLCDPLPTIGVNGVFLYSPGSTGGTISEIAAASDTLPGETQPTSFVPFLSIPVNSPGQVAFGAQVGAPPGSQGFFLRKVVDTPQKVVAMGDPISGTTTTFGFPHFISGLNDQGNLAFTAATNAAADGLFFAPAGGGPIQTLALDGGPAPGGGSFLLTPPVSTQTTPGIGSVAIGSGFFKNFAAVNGESDIAFGAGLTGGTANSGYFRAMPNGPAAGALQAVMLQGQPAPGGGTFGPIPLVSTLGADFALGPDGALAFVNIFTDGSGRKLGLFVVHPDGNIVKVLGTGETPPGGGVLAGLALRRLAAGDAGKFAFFAGIEGGSARRAIFVTSIPGGTAATTTTLKPLQDPVVAQRPIALTATVTSTTAGTPTGTVNFFDNGVSLGAGALNGGQATLTTSSLGAGPHSIVAQYDGDSSFAPGNSSPLAEVVAGFTPPPATPFTVTAAQPLVIPLTLFAPAGANMNFTLSCSGLPANLACSFDLNPVAPSQSGTTVNLKLTKTAGSELPPVQPYKGPLLPGVPGFSAILCALLAAGMIKFRQAPQRRLAFGTCLAVVALALTMVGCGTVSSSGSGSPGTPPSPTAITVTGTSGMTTVTAVVNVIVQ
jgi:hypothetical protein